MLSVFGPEGDRGLILLQFKAILITVFDIAVWYLPSILKSG